MKLLVLVPVFCAVSTAAVQPAHAPMGQVRKVYPDLKLQLTETPKFDQIPKDWPKFEQIPTQWQAMKIIPVESKPAAGVKQKRK
jgi:hypothetical protein